MISPDQAGGHTRDAGVGAGGVPPVDALAPPHVQVRANKDIQAQQFYPIKVPYTNIFLSRQSALSGALILFTSVYFRPGEKITRKTIMMANKMKELDMKETSSKSLLSNVLDMDDDFRSTTLPTSAPVHHPSHVTGHQNAGFVRSVYRIYREFDSKTFNLQKHQWSRKDSRAGREVFNCYAVVRG